MRILKTTISVVTVSITGLIACSSSGGDNKSTQTEETTQPPSEVKKLPAFAMTDASGKSVNLCSFEGKKVFVNLWATWCPPCRAEMPSIEALATKVNKENAVFVMLSLDEDFEVAKNFVNKENLYLPVYFSAEDLPALFKTNGIPATFIFNENGNLVKQNNGADDYNTDLYIDLLTMK